jgi:hypothetical protein
MMLHAVVGIVLATQSPSAAMTGIVRDRATGEPLPGVVVVLSDISREVVTDGGGRYAVRAVPPGPQHVRFQRLGYASRALHALVPESGELSIDVSLSAMPIPLERIHVQPRLPVRGTEPADTPVAADRSVSAAAIRSHPLLAEPDAFLALGGGAVLIKPEAPAGVHVRGGAADHVAYVLDGIPVFQPFHGHGVLSAWNPDAISRLDLFAAAPPVQYPDALAGVVAGTTRSPSTRFQAQGSFSTVQARATADGPLGKHGAGFLLSVRSAFPGAFAPKADPSYLHGETADALITIEAPLLHGRFRFLGFHSRDELDAAAVADPLDAAATNTARNAFAWQSRSLGLAWDRPIANLTLSLKGWSASGQADARWLAARGGTQFVEAGRSEQGLFAVIRHNRDDVRSAAGVRITGSHTSFAVISDLRETVWSAETSGPLVSAFVEHARPTGGTTQMEAMLSLARLDGSLYASPRARFRWQPGPPMALTLSLAQLYQFTQSLRNAESIVGAVFPVDLALGAGSRVPVAISRQAGVSLEVRPRPGLALNAAAHVRDLGGLVLVAPREGEPFVTREFASGAGSVLGAAFDAAWSTARLGLIASYGWQRVRLEHDDSAYVPDHGTAHNLDAGLIVYPGASTSIRVGAQSLFGRRSTLVPGTIEWESCNLLDRGCEFSGSPHYGMTPLGAARLPAYLRVDFGLRHHWHIAAGGRDLTVAFFGTITNVLGRENLLGFTADPRTDTRLPIEMLSRGPLVLGLDWRF